MFSCVALPFQLSGTALGSPDQPRGRTCRPCPLQSGCAQRVCEGSGDGGRTGTAGRRRGLFKHGVGKLMEVAT